MTVRATRAITLPHGALVDGVPRRDAELRPPTGADEAYLLEEGGALSRAELVTALLERCTVSLAGRRASAALVRSLTAGDREALLLHLRSAALGDRLSCVVDCPSCDERLDLDVSVDDLLLDPYLGAREWYDFPGTGGERQPVRFRLPTGEDLEAAAREDSVESGLRTIVGRCVEGELDDDSLEALSEAMEALDPQAEVRLELRCPDCGERFTALLDAASLLVEELAGADELLRDVHELALAYHWSERDILELDLGRRRRYLELLALTTGPGEPL